MIQIITSFMYIAHFVTKEKDIFLDQHKLQIFPHKDFLIDFYTKVFSDLNILLSIQEHQITVHYLDEPSLEVDFFSRPFST